MAYELASPPTSVAIEHSEQMEPFDDIQMGDVGVFHGLAPPLHGTGSKTKLSFTFSELIRDRHPRCTFSRLDGSDSLPCYYNQFHFLDSRSLDDDGRLF